MKNIKILAIFLILSIQGCPTELTNRIEKLMTSSKIEFKKTMLSNMQTEYELSSARVEDVIYQYEKEYEIKPLKNCSSYLLYDNGKIVGALDILSNTTFLLRKSKNMSEVH